MQSQFLSKNQPGRHGSREDMPGVFPRASASLSFISLKAKMLEKSQIITQDLEGKSRA